MLLRVKADPSVQRCFAAIRSRLHCMPALIECRDQPLQLNARASNRQCSDLLKRWPSSGARFSKVRSVGENRSLFDTKIAATKTIVRSSALRAPLGSHSPGIRRRFRNCEIRPGRCLVGQRSESKSQDNIYKLSWQVFSLIHGGPFGNDNSKPEYQ